MSSKRFKKVYIEITSCCNLQCKFCPPTKRQAEFLTVEKFKFIVNQVKAFTDHIYLHVKGEPLLHPYLSDILDIAQTESLRVHIITNGTLIEKQAEMLLSKPALHKINFSLHSFEQNNREFDNTIYINNILRFSKLAGQTKRIIVSLRLWNLENESLNQQLNTCNTEIIQQIESALALDKGIDKQSIPGNGLKLAPYVYLNFDKEFVWPNLQADYQSTMGFCQALRDQTAILVDGTVVPCCLDGEGIIQLGNIYNQSFDAIINSQRAQAIYNGFSQNKAIEELCQKCRFKERFSK